MDEWLASDKSKAPRAKWESHFSFQFAAAMKATYYFVRALQDSVYAALLEGTGHRAGAYSSMHDCAKNTANPVYRLINQAPPDYFTWFADFRDVRSLMKSGVSTAFGCRGVEGAKEVLLILQDVHDAQRSLVDLGTCLRHSERLLRFAAEHLAAAA